MLAGSLLLPLNGEGDKNGLSVSKSKLFKGKDLIISRKLFAFLKVIIPDNEI